MERFSKTPMAAKLAHRRIFVWLLLPVVLALAMPAEAATKRKKKTATKATPAAVPRKSTEDIATENGKGKGSMPKEFRQLQPGELPLTAQGAIVIDGLTGQALYEKNPDLPLYPASTTKIMTALLVIEAGNLDREVTITEEDSKVGESSLQIKPGDRYTRRQMLYGLMLKSANDVAHALGRDNAGTAEAFALKMTRRAQELGAFNTSFRNAHGLHHVEHFTTARDLALIARYAMNQPFFRTVVSTTRYQWVRFVGPEQPIGTPAEIWNLSNHNRLLTRFDGCTGVKTGYTNPAQHTLVSAARRAPREVIAVVMKDGKLQKWEDSMLLLTHGLDHPPKSDGGMAASN
jgi:serine-type D-Ala-D-Ala carboxypeptidase (penicillin-binding protein 5/6)